MSPQIEPDKFDQPVLVTGVSGFVGGYVVSRLRNSGIPCIGLSRTRLQSSPSLIVGDLADEDFMLSLTIRPRCIVHIAANSGRGGETAQQLHRDNVIATRNLVGLAQRSQCTRIIYISSVSVHGRVTQSPLNENSPILDPKPYGRSKYEAEQCLNLASGSMEIVSLRLPGVLGVNAPMNWLISVVAKARAGAPITIHHSDALFNNAVHVDDLGAFIAKLIDAEWLPSFDSFPLACSQPVPIRELVNAVVATTGSTSEVRELLSEELNFYIDDSHARSRFGYTAMTMLDAMTKFTCEPETEPAP